MLRQPLGIMRELPRLREIATVFVRHGLGDFVQRIGIAGVLERAGQIVHWGEANEAVKLVPLEDTSGKRVLQLEAYACELPDGWARILTRRELTLVLDDQNRRTRAFTIEEAKAPKQPAEPELAKAGKG